MLISKREIAIAGLLSAINKRVMAIAGLLWCKTGQDRLITTPAAAPAVNEVSVAVLNACITKREAWITCLNPLIYK